jgi:hypothetical protein
MRMFWGLIAVMMLAGAGYLFGRMGGTEPSGREPEGTLALATRPEAAPAVPALPAPNAEEPGPEVSPEPATETVPEPEPEPAMDQAAEGEADSADAMSEAGEAALAAGALDEMLGTLTGEAVVDSAPEASADPAPTVASESAEPDAAPEAAMSEAPAPAEAPAEEVGPKPMTFAGYEVIPATKEPRADGVMLDGRHLLKGKGTEAEPYKITWDLLMSSSETLVPRQGKKKLPEAVTMLDGAWVELSGYIAFPLMVQEADELLLMLNQWDGCCIGIPPTPYDAIEVVLTQPAKGQDRFAVQGTLRGRLGVKPHLVGEWLVGIYTMDAATLSTSAVGGFAQ